MKKFEKMLKILGLGYLIIYLVLFSLDMIFHINWLIIVAMAIGLIFNCAIFYFAITED